MKEYVFKEDVTAQELKDFFKDKSPLDIKVKIEKSSDTKVQRYMEIDGDLSFLEDITREMESVLEEEILQEKYPNLKEFYMHCLTRLDAIIDSAEIEKGRCSCCSSGCDSCCKGNLITITYPEATIIKQYMESSEFTSKKRRMVLRRIKEQVDILSKEGFTSDVITEADNDANLTHEVKVKYHSLNLDCVFLDEGKCMIHKVRPLDCWAFRQYVSEFFCEKALMVLGSFDYQRIKQYLMVVLLSNYDRDFLSKTIVTNSLPAMMDEIINS